MNTKYLLTVFLIVLFGVFFYLVGSFASASFLLNEWREGLRMVVALVVTVVSIFTVLITNELL